MRRAVLRTLTLGLVASALLLSGCRGEAGRSAQSADERVPVETVRVGRAVVTPTLSYSGTVMPARKALLGAQIQGRVERLHVDVGDRVKTGDLLVELGSEQLTQAHAQYIAAEKDWERMKSLREKGVVTEQAFEKMDAAYEAARAAYEMVLESARITAPFDGVVTERFLDEGEVFTLMSMVTPTPAIVELASIDSVEVVVEVPEGDSRRLVVGLRARVTADACPGEVFDGVVCRVDPSLDLMSRTATVDVVVPNRSERLRPGMFADVEIDLREREVLLVPREAVIQQEASGLFYAYVVEDGVARRRDLGLGESYGAGIEVLRGLAEGDEVVTAGRYRVQDGSPVDVKRGPSTSDAGTAGEGGGR